ncbi:spermatogenesis-associated serine-rich protein 1 [Spea bombifrons]|uniref:spermatogenesis-associated serine-rich protein 1 n=1 Tax=Spea bombifrons TaxID=233779 RepID=UPI002349D9AE|nr:spermatogenesis-associated serine-rich protein 1 [Spea bombifrons]
MNPDEKMTELGKQPSGEDEEKGCKIRLRHGLYPNPPIQSQEWNPNPHLQSDKGICLPPIRWTMPVHPNCDLDWKPSARWLPSPRYPDAPYPHIKDIKFPEGIRLLRSFPKSFHDVGAEWTFYPNQGLPFAYHTGKRCIFQGTHWGNQTSADVSTLPTYLRTKKKVTDPRNGIPAASLGDKAFSTPEYSPGFHKLGSTRPLVNFKDSYKLKSDTFIPLQKLSNTSSVPYRIKAQCQSLQEEKRDVEKLNEWKPARRSFLIGLPNIGQKVQTK